MSIIVPTSGVTSAYAAGKLTGIAGPAQPVAGIILPKRGSFPELVGNAVKDAINTVRQGERKAAAGLEGKASTQDVVQATMSAELTVQAAVAVRDKLVNAYLEIMRMPV